ncbi:MAG: hypothetical protein U5K84_09965 [Alkalibacterium sp.]|nr:hypothetical protein [Alkalibacterium sp.]
MLDAEIGGDINSDVSDIGYPTAFLIMAKYSSADKMPTFKQVVEETLTEPGEKRHRQRPDPGSTQQDHLPDP